MTNVNEAYFLFANSSHGNGPPKDSILMEDTQVKEKLSDVQRNAVIQIAKCGDVYLDGSEDIREAYQALLENPKAVECDPKKSFKIPLQAPFILSHMRNVYEKLGVELIENQESAQDRQEGVRILTKAIELGSTNLDVYEKFSDSRNNPENRLRLFLTGLNREGFPLEDRLKLFKLIDDALIDQAPERAGCSSKCATFTEDTSISELATMIFFMKRFFEESLENLRKKPYDEKIREDTLARAYGLKSLINQLMEKVDKTVKQGKYSIDPEVLKSMRSREAKGEAISWPNYDVQLELAHIIYDHDWINLNEKIGEINNVIVQIESGTIIF